jgi:hypothetical protein
VWRSFDNRIDVLWKSARACHALTLSSFSKPVVTQRAAGGTRACRRRSSGVLNTKDHRCGEMIVARLHLSSGVAHDSCTSNDEQPMMAGAGVVSVPRARRLRSPARAQRAGAVASGMTASAQRLCVRRERVIFSCRRLRRGRRGDGSRHKPRRSQPWHAGGRRWLQIWSHQSDPIRSPRRRGRGSMAEWRCRAPCRPSC